MNVQRTKEGVITSVRTAPAASDVPVETGSHWHQMAAHVLVVLNSRYITIVALDLWFLISFRNC